MTEAGHDAAYVVVCRLTKMVHLVKLVNRRTFITNGEKVYYYRVKWVGYPSSKNTWEPEQQLREDGLGDHIDDYDASYPRELAPKTRGGKRR